MSKGRRRKTPQSQRKTRGSEVKEAERKERAEGLKMADERAARSARNSARIPAADGTPTRSGESPTGINPARGEGSGSHPGAVFGTEVRPEVRASRREAEKELRHSPVRAAMAAEEEDRMEPDETPEVQPRGPGLAVKEPPGNGAAQPVPEHDPGDGAPLPAPSAATRVFSPIASPEWDSSDPGSDDAMATHNEGTDPGEGGRGGSEGEWDSGWSGTRATCKSPSGKARQLGRNPPPTRVHQSGNQSNPEDTEPGEKAPDRNEGKEQGIRARPQLSMFAYRPREQDLNSGNTLQRSQCTKPPDSGGQSLETSAKGGEPFSVKQPASLGEDLKLLLQSIPTKADLSRTETNIRSDIRAIQEQVDGISSRVSVLETHQDATGPRFAAIEEAQGELRASFDQYRASQQIKMLALQNHLDDLENRHRRNNVRIRGVPERVSGDSIKTTILAIFRTVLGGDPTRSIELDRVHRSLGPVPEDPARSRDIICRIHLYTIKEELLRKAWDNSPLEWEGHRIQILPDVSRRTLNMRRVLKPLLTRIKEVGASYRWGFPFQLVVRKNGSSFLLKTPSELADLFDFLGIAPFPIPDWLSDDLVIPLPQRPHRRGRFAQRGRGGGAGGPARANRDDR